MTTFRLWDCGNNVDITTGDAVTIFRCGSGLMAFGEPGRLARATKQHLIFVTESGAEVKTPIDNISYTVGKAKVEGYCVSLRAFESFEHMIKEVVRFWNEKTCEMEKK
jgi:hypothetical protein